MTIFDELKARGLLAQLTDEEEIKELINNGKATFYIPSELAYGERGTRGISPNSVLIFDVEVVRIGKAAEKTEE